MPAAEAGGVGFGGLIPLAPGGDVVEVVVAGGSSAAGELAVLVAGDDGGDDRGGRSVGPGAGVQYVSVVVGEQPPPGGGGVGGDAAGHGRGDRPVPVQFTGVVVQAHQRRRRDRHLHRRSLPVTAGQPGPGRRGTIDGARGTGGTGASRVIAGPAAGAVRLRVGEGGAGQVDQGVGAALVGAALVTTRAVDGGVGHRVQGGLDDRGAVGGQVRPQLGHAVLGRGEDHPPLSDRIAVRGFLVSRVGHPKHRPFHRGPELGRGQLRRPPQHRGFHGRDLLDRQGTGGVDQDGGVPLTDLTGPQQRQRRG